MEFKRSDRVADLIQKEIAELLYRNVKDPRLGAVTITGVEVSDDLRYARVFYTFRGDEAERENVTRGLSKAKGFFRKELGRRLRLRYVPELDFRYDASFDYGAKIERLLKEVSENE